MTDREIFMNAPAGASPEVLERYLAKMCGDDAELRKRVEALLAADEEAGTEFMGEDALKVARGLELGLLSDSGEATLDDGVPVAEGEGDTIGNYKLLQKIGEGGFGVVYMADQLKPVKRRVAFKVIKLGMDTKQVVARFEAERQALAMMDHPNIAKVHDAGATETGRPFFVMELVKGVPITKFCDENNLSTEERLDLYIDVCRAVQHAHQKGIIHRDLKPSNVMVTMHDDKAVPKVIDFGVAKATQQDLTDKTLYTRYEQFIGTPAYMSPEQAQLSGLDIDTRSDIYALGVLLYELLTGRTPFDAKKLLKAGYDEIRRVIREEEPPKPSTRLSTLGDAELTDLAKTRRSGPNRLRALMRGDLDWIVMKALEKDRTRRYETANALAMDVRRHLDDEPVSAAAPSASYRIAKYLRRHRGPVLAAAAMMILLGSGASLTTWQWLRARSAERVAIERADGEEQARLGEKRAREQADESAAKARANAESLRHRAYTADMGLAAAAIEQGDLGRARMLLDRYRPQDAQADIRGFEWRYLWARSRGEETATLGEYKGWLGGIAASPDGTMLAYAGPTTLVRERPSGRILAELGDVNGSLTFSPDGRVLFNAGSGEIRRWDTGTWNELPRIEGANHPCALAQRRPLLVARDGDGLAVWSTEDGSKQQTLSDSVRWKNPHWNFHTLAISADDALVFASSRDLAIRSWNLDDGSERPPIKLEDRHLVVSVAVSSRNVLAVGNFSGSLTLWDAATGTKLQSLSDHDAWVSRAVFSPDGTMLASASADQKILLYDMNSDGTASFRRRFVGHEAEIWALSFSADGAWLYSGSSHDGTLRLWSTAPAADDAEILEDVLVQHASPQLGLYGLHHQDKPVYIDFTTGRPKIEDLSFPTKLDASEFLHLPWRSLASRETEEGIEFWSTRSGQREKLLPGTFRSLKLSEDGSLLAALGSHGLQVWDMGNWKEILSDPRFAENDTEKLYFSADNSKIALTPPQYRTGEAVVLSLATGEEVMRFPAEQIMASGFSPDGTIFAAGSGRSVIVLWDLEAKEQVAVMRGHVSGIKGLAFSPDGRTIASCGGNRVRLWNVETRQEILTLHQGDATASRAWFSSDGSTLVTTTVGPSIRFWRAPGFEEIAEFEASDTGLDEIRRRTLRERLALGPEHRKSAEEYRKLVDSLGALGEFDTLRAQFEKELTRQKALDEPDLTALDILVASVRAGGRGKEALEMQRSLVELAEPDSIRARDAQRKVARHAVSIGNWEVGKNALRDAIAIPSEEKGLSMDEMKLAALLLWSGDVPTYESYTRTWVKRYQDAEGPLVPDRVSKCYFAAERERDEALDSLAAELAERTSAPDAPDWFAPWGALCRGIAEYRTGKHKEALKSLITAQNGNAACKASAHAYSAMAAHKLGDAAGTQKHLEEARAANEPILKPGEGDLGSSWHDRVFALLALKEAESLINAEEKAQP